MTDHARDEVVARVADRDDKIACSIGTVYRGTQAEPVLKRMRRPRAPGPGRLVERLNELIGRCRLGSAITEECVDREPAPEGPA